jgi:hypothetical protein
MSKSGTFRPGGINALRNARYLAYASKDAEAIRKAEADIVAFQKAHPVKKGKGRSDGQRRWIANAKRNGWL